ncbi:MAG TPA: glycosyltransferase family 2 protein [Acidimicrobiales bacterium]|nr:glycosyltransferase family 2 protein [Acidimicrobiales bacterium]
MSDSGARGLAATLRVQTVLYENATDDVVRFASGMSAACTYARGAGVIESAELAFGDCSPEPVAQGADDLLAGGPRPFADVSYLHFGANLGSAGGHNRLFAESHADLVLVVNPDTYASPHLVAELVAGISEAGVGIVEGRQLPLEHPKAYDPETGDVSWASGSCFLVRKQVLEDTGGFDTEFFFLHGDDVDLSWRARLAGWRVVHRPAARVFHDKRLDDTGVIRAGARELEQSAIVSVMLPWRYSRRDLALERLDALEASTEELSRTVAATLRARVDAGEMPEPIDPEHRVGEFVGDDYARHRFSYADA